MHMVSIPSIWLAHMYSIAFNQSQEEFNRALSFDVVITPVSVASELHRAIRRPQDSVLVEEAALDQLMPNVRRNEGINILKFACFNPVQVSDTKARGRFLRNIFYKTHFWCENVTFSVPSFY